jgi:ribokinase
MKPHITVVGSINMDMVFKTPRMPTPGETLMGRDFHQIHGGKGANQAVAAARMGATVNFIACVGDDVNGASCLQTLKNDDIDLQYIRVVPNQATGVAGILLDDQGENCIVLTTGANALISKKDIDKSSGAFENAKLLLCQLETPMETVVHAIEYAKKNHIKVILNPAPAHALSDYVLAQVDYLVVNETEASLLSGKPVTDVASAEIAATVLRERGVKCVLITLGAHGMWLSSDDERYFLPAFKVKVVDTTAAGDTFVGSFAVAIAEGLELPAACMFAQSAAALAVTKLGAQSSIPFRDEVERQLQEARMPL